MKVDLNAILEGGETSCSVSEQEIRQPRELKPIHRLMAYAVACGRSRLDLTEDTGYPFEEIVKVTNGQKFQEVVGEFIQQQGEDQAQKRLESAVMDSIATLVKLRDNPTVKDVVRLQASIYILNRVKGTPSQFIVTERRSSQDPQDELAEIEAQLHQLHTVAQLRKVEKTVQAQSQVGEDGIS